MGLLEDIQTAFSPGAASDIPGYLADSANYSLGNTKRILTTPLDQLTDQDWKDAFSGMMGGGTLKAAGSKAAGSLAQAAQGAKAELGPLEEFVIQQAEKGRPLLRQNFRPMLVHKPTGITMQGPTGGYHGDMYPELMRRIRGGVSGGDTIHQFATPEGVPVNEAAFHVLTGPPELLKEAADMLKKGTNPSLMWQAMQDIISGIGGNR